MASSPKITVTIPKSLKVSAKEKAALKQAFNAAAVRVLKTYGRAGGAEITNWGGSTRGGSTKAGKKKAAKKKAAKKR